MCLQCDGSNVRHISPSSGKSIYIYAHLHKTSTTANSVETKNGLKVAWAWEDEGDGNIRSSVRKVLFRVVKTV